MEDYINNYKKFDKSYVYDFRLGMGGIGDYIKFFMIILKECMDNNIKFYHRINNLEIEKYIKLKYDILNISNDEILKLNNVTIKHPGHYYYNNDKYNGNIYSNEVFYFDDIIKNNVENIAPSLPSNYISIHLRLGDKFLETDMNYVLCKNDTRKFSIEKIYKFIEDNSDKNIVFLCDNNSEKINLKKKYKNIIIPNSQIGHTSLKNTTNKQILDTITEFYILSNSQLIYAASNSGFSIMAANLGKVKIIK